MSKSKEGDGGREWGRERKGGGRRVSKRDGEWREREEGGRGRGGREGEGGRGREGEGEGERGMEEWREMEEGGRGKRERERLIPYGALVALLYNLLVHMHVQVRSFFVIVFLIFLLLLQLLSLVTRVLMNELLSDKVYILVWVITGLTILGFLPLSKCSGLVQLIILPFRNVIFLEFSNNRFKVG